MKPLTELHREIDLRVAEIRSEHPDWPCAKGCARCCRQLANIPQLVEAEWRLLKDFIDTQPPSLQVRLCGAVAALRPDAARPVVCPMLDAETDACLVYPARPVACRTYGFYVQREKGLYCASIEASVAAGEYADVVWGNQDGADRSVQALGTSRSLLEWFASAGLTVQLGDSGASVR